MFLSTNSRPKMTLRVGTLALACIAGASCSSAGHSPPADAGGGVPDSPPVRVLVDPASSDFCGLAAAIVEANATLHATGTLGAHPADLAETTRRLADLAETDGFDQEAQTLAQGFDNIADGGVVTVLQTEPFFTAGLAVFQEIEARCDVR